MEINIKKVSSCSKRLEECYKLALKKGIRQLSVALKHNTDSRRLSKYEFEQLFMSMYFGEESLTGGSGQTIFNPSTINSDYISFIKQSEILCSDLAGYISECFISDYRESRSQKLCNVLVKCYECLGLKRKGFDNVRKYIEDNPKCKLPWTDLELEYAKTVTLALLKE